MTRFRWGILGTGAISAKFVAGLTSARDAEAVLVISRTQERAERFAAAVGIKRALVGYAEAAAAGGVDAVYVASPPSLHASHSIAFIEAGIPVLIEKPFASSAQEARRIADAARAHGVFAMEAMWTRFLPAAQRLREQVARHEIGSIHLVTGSFGTSQRLGSGNGMFDSNLGGGALAHLGAYPLSLGQWLFGTPELVQAVGSVGPTGVDQDAAFLLRYPGGTLGSFWVSLRAWAPDDFRLHSSNAMVSVRGSIVRPHGLEIFREAPLAYASPTFNWKAQLRQHPLVHQVAQWLDYSGRSRSARHTFRYTGNGYHYEANEVRACVMLGLVESQVMPLEESIAVAETVDAIRQIILDKCKQVSAMP